jgi:hypothetical protein
VTIQTIRQGIANNLASIAGLRSSWFVPDNPTPPIAIVVPERVDFDTAMRRGLDTYTFRVLVIAQRASERNAQSTLDTFCDPTGATSVKAAIESDRTLGGTANDCRVTDLTDYGPLTVGETQYLAATFSVTVIQ